MDAIVFSLLNVIDIVLNLFSWMLIISVIMTWLAHFNIINPHNQVVSAIGGFLYRMTEPVLAPIRRRLPDLGGIDLSPVVVILAIIFLRTVLRGWMVGV